MRRLLPVGGASTACRSRGRSPQVSRVVLALLLATWWCAAGCRDSSSPTTLPTITVRIGAHALVVEVASDPESRARGLMFRQELPGDEGMLFVFPSAQPRSFWMRNTFVPLSIAFLDGDRHILNIEQMQPLDEVTRTVSAGPATYALEVNQGWFQQRQISPGATVSFTLPTDLVVR